VEVSALVSERVCVCMSMNINKRSRQKTDEIETIGFLLARYLERRLVGLLSINDNYATQAAKIKPLSRRTEFSLGRLRRAGV